MTLEPGADPFHPFAVRLGRRMGVRPGEQQAGGDGGGGGTQAAPVRDRVVRLQAQSVRRGDPQRLQPGEEGRDDQVRGVPGDVVGTLAGDIDIDAGRPSGQGDLVEPVEGHAHAVEARAEIGRGCRDADDDPHLSAPPPASGWTPRTPRGWPRARRRSPRHRRCGRCACPAPTGRSRWRPPDAWS
ncbi:hypothetical protein SDC9_102114 [bioreactor metagenome]|uniref:Uncharacterized protein n=1 Tax=bioreactor metagenome TaxID=1076179 RepID=A0A645AQD6_9ZZZZ